MHTAPSSTHDRGSLWMSMAALLILPALLAHCGRSSATAAKPSASGLASSYPAGHHGAHTTSGEPYNRHAFTAAHATLPIGTRLRVRNLHNGREVIVRINDRLSSPGSTLLRVSTKAALNLRMSGGAAPVEFAVVTESGHVASANSR